MSGWCDSPIPRMNRPPLIDCAVSACCAITTGWRGYVGTTAVPRSMPGTSRPTTASAAIASIPIVCGSQNDVYPALAASRAASTILSMGPLAASPR